MVIRKKSLEKFEMRATTSCATTSVAVRAPSGGENVKLTPEQTFTLHCYAYISRVSAVIANVNYIYICDLSRDKGAHSNWQ